MKSIYKIFNYMIRVCSCQRRWITGILVKRKGVFTQIMSMLSAEININPRVYS